MPLPELSTFSIKQSERLDTPIPKLPKLSDYIIGERPPLEDEDIGRILLEEALKGAKGTLAAIRRPPQQPSVAEPFLGIAKAQTEAMVRAGGRIGAQFGKELEAPFAAFVKTIPPATAREPSLTRKGIIAARPVEKVGRIAGEFVAFPFTPLGRLMGVVGSEALGYFKKFFGIGKVAKVVPGVPKDIEAVVGEGTSVADWLRVNKGSPQAEYVRWRVTGTGTWPKWWKAQGFSGKPPSPQDIVDPKYKTGFNKMMEVVKQEVAEVPPKVLPVKAGKRITLKEFREIETKPVVTEAPPVAPPEPPTLKPIVKVAKGKRVTVEQYRASVQRLEELRVKYPEVAKDLAKVSGESEIKRIKRFKGLMRVNPLYRAVYKEAGRGYIESEWLEALDRIQTKKMPEVPIEAPITEPLPGVVPEVTIEPTAIGPLAEIKPLPTKPIAKVRAKPVTPRPKKVAILPRKKALLAEIQEAIDKAPDVKATAKTSKVKFEIDGGAKIFNTKAALTEFHKRVRKMGKEMLVPQEPKFLKKKVPTVKQLIAEGKIEKVVREVNEIGREALVAPEPPAKPVVARPIPVPKPLPEIRNEKTQALVDTINKMPKGTQVAYQPVMTAIAEGKNYSTVQRVYDQIQTSIEAGDLALMTGELADEMLESGIVKSAKPKTFTEHLLSESHSSFDPEKGFERRPVSSEKATEITKRSDIVKFLQDKLDIPIRTGRFRGAGRRVLGIFKHREEVVRTAFANDIEVIAHEIGHALHKFLWGLTPKGGLSAKPLMKFRAELDPIATKAKAGQSKLSEGFAEFMRLYVTNEKKAREVAPKFYEHFEKVLIQKSPEAQAILLKAREDFERWIKQPAIARVLSQVSIGKKERLALSFDDLYAATIDDLFPLKRVVSQMTKGEEIPVSKDPYKIARLSRGWWGKADSFLEYKPLDFKTLQPIKDSKSLRDILLVVKDNLDEYRAYLISKRAIEIKQKRGAQTGVRIEDATEVVKTLRGKFEESARDLVAYQNHVLKYLKDSGIISIDSFDMWSEMYKAYVPFYSDVEKLRNVGAGKGYEAYNPVKKIRDSWSDIVDPLESIIKNTYVFINLAERNSVGTALVKLAAKKEGLGLFIEKIPQPLKKQKVSIVEALDSPVMQAVLQVLTREDPFVVKLMTEMVKGTAKGLSFDIFRPSPFSPKENVIAVWQHGERKLYQVHPDIARSIQALDREDVGTVIRLMSYPSKLLRLGATLTPEFSVARNPIRDQFSAFVFSKYGFKPGIDFTRGIFHTLKQDDLYWKWKASGGEHSMLVSLDREYLRKGLDALLKRKGVFLPNIRNVVKNPIEMLRMISEFTETGTRMGEFINVYNKEGKTPEAILSAGFASREITVDFAKLGSKSKVLNALIAFWNAQVQGMDRMVRAFKSRPFTTTYRVLLGITIPSIILAIVNHDNKRYKELSQWQKDLFWIIDIGEDKPLLRIPKPFELGILFGTVPERIVDYILNKNPRAFDELLETVMGGAMPGFIPTVMVPLLEGWANKSFFTGRPLVSKGQEKLLPQYQYYPHTAEIAKVISHSLSKLPYIGDTVTISPIKIENLVRGWSGGLGMSMLRALDVGAKRIGALPTRVMPTKTLSDIPFVRALFVRYPSGDTLSISRFYKNYAKASSKVLTIRTLIRRGEITEAQAVQRQGKLLKLNKHYEALRVAHRVVEAVYESPDLSPQEKRKFIDTLYLQMIVIAKRGNEMFDLLEKKK